MATLSRKTLGLTIRLLNHLTRTDIEHFLFEMEVPNNLVLGSSKMDMLLNVFKELENSADEVILRNIVFGACQRLSNDNKQELQEALVKDGFVIDGKDVAKDVPIAENNRSSLEILINRNASYFDIGILTHHLKENIELFHQEKWDSAIGQARNFVEQLLKDIARAIAGNTNENLDISRPVKVREYLRQCGFFDDAERQKLVDGVYGYFSEQGSHPGISKQSTARVCMHILWAFAYYVLEKFEDWKQPNA